jgi:signal transduction histidine kinase/DNA-binding response OmpR family regulator
MLSEMVPEPSYGYEDVVTEILHNVHDGHYSTILGPQFFGKSQLLLKIQKKLLANKNVRCILVDLNSISFITDEEFLEQFAATLLTLMQEDSWLPEPFPKRIVRSKKQLQNFFQELIKSCDNSLVLMLDHLESIRTAPLKSLLLVLRAIFNEQDPNEVNRFIVITASSLTLADLNLGDNSPFNIARMIILKDLTPSQSKEMIDHLLSEQSSQFEESSLHLLISAVGGDRNLLPKLFFLCLQLARNAERKIITEQDVQSAMNFFLQEEVDDYLPLREIVRVIESDSNNLFNILKILDQGIVARKDLNLELELFPDKLTLTGAVKFDVKDDVQFYTIRNRIYESFLRKHFNTERVVQVLTLAGLWDDAIQFLDKKVANEPQFRSVLLETIVHSINASRNMNEVRQKLGEHTCKAFKASQVRLYLINPERSQLQLFSHYGAKESDLVEFISLEEDLPETRVINSNDPIVDIASNGEKILLIPLFLDGKEPLGVVIFYQFVSNQKNIDNLELLSFLRHLSHAIVQVLDYDRKVLQLTKLNKVGNTVISSLELNLTLQSTIEAAIEAVPAAQKGSLFLWDEKLQVLRIFASKGFSSDIVDMVQLQKGEGVAGWVFENKKPLISGNVEKDPQIKRIDHPEFILDKSMIGVPLEAKGIVIGVLCLDNFAANNAFRSADVELLETFAFQAAIAIENARLFKEAQQARIDADSANKAKSFFLAVMSHEIRTQLNAIIGMSDILSNTLLDSVQRGFITTICNSGENLLSIVNDTLDYSKIEAGKIDLEENPMELRQCIESTLDQFTFRADEKGIDLDYQISDNVPVIIVSDVLRLKQILANLLGNAIKFTIKGQIELSTDLATSNSKSDDKLEIHFAIKDTGIGITKERIQHLFQPFDQGDASISQIYGGTGLGLAISKRICELFGGRIWAESQLGKGSTFHFTIKALPSEEATNNLTLQDIQPKLSNKHVLVLYDNETKRRKLITQIKNWGMLTSETDSLSEFFQWIDGVKTFDIVILDLHMPKVDILTIAKNIREKLVGRPLPLVLFSSIGERDYEITPSIPVTVLTRPVWPTTLLGILIDLLCSDQQIDSSEDLVSFSKKEDTTVLSHPELSILLAEDNLVNQSYAIHLLSRLGYHADLVKNGRETIRALEHQHYDVILMDVQMPEMDGIEASKIICDRWPQEKRPYIIAMTANAMQGDREMCIQAGMNDYISKPFRATELLQALRKAKPIII